MRLSLAGYTIASAMSGRLRVAVSSRSASDQPVRTKSLGFRQRFKLFVTGLLSSWSS